MKDKKKFIKKQIENTEPKNITIFIICTLILFASLLSSIEMQKDVLKAMATVSTEAFVISLIVLIVTSILFLIIYVYIMDKTLHLGWFKRNEKESTLVSLKKEKQPKRTSRKIKITLVFLYAFFLFLSIAGILWLFLFLTDIFSQGKEIQFVFTYEDIINVLLLLFYIFCLFILFLLVLYLYYRNAKKERKK